MYVCPPGYLRNHMCDLYQFYVRIAYGRGPVLLRQGNEISRGREVLGVFFPTDIYFAAEHLGPL